MRNPLKAVAAMLRPPGTPLKAPPKSMQVDPYKEHPDEAPGTAHRPPRGHGG